MQMLSPHFTLAECRHTAHANIDNTPDAVALAHLPLTAMAAEPFRAQFGPLFVSSGYRCPRLNAAIGGVHDSAHIYGCALDLVPLTPGVTVTQMVAWGVANGLIFDQLIDEGAGEVAWMHLGICRPGFELTPRLEALVYRNGVYSQFNP